MLTMIIYILLAVGIGLVILGAFDVTRHILNREGSENVVPRSPTPYLSALAIIVGIGSLGTSGYLSLRKPADVTVAQVPPSPTATPETATSAPRVTPTDSRPAISSGEVTIDPPSSGTKVGQCDIFTGKSNLPPGETVVLGVRNLSDTGNTTYLEPVNNWNSPGALPNWTGAQYFGSGDSSIGQTYLVSVIEMASETVKTALAEPANHNAWAVNSLPAGSSIKNTLKLVRISGQGPLSCR
jgi:hypothetical protein